jgi:hypothetical protein
MNGEPSSRIVEQRLRNRAHECFEYLADGDQAVRTLGFKEYFELFFDQFPCDGTWSLALLDDAEIQATQEVLDMMRAALEATPSSMAEEDFIQSGWPERIRPVATRAVEIFLTRGRSNEEAEEIAPTPSKR